MSMGRATCPLLWAAALGAAQPCGVSLTTRGIAPACLRRHIVRLGGPLLPFDLGLGRECPLPGGAVPDGPAAPGKEVRPVPPGVTVQDGLVASRLQHQCPPLLRP